MFSNLPIAEINFKSLELCFQQKAMEMNIGLNLGNFQLIDLSNYPHTLNKEEEFELIVPREMIGILENSQSLLNVSVVMYSEGNKKIENNNTMLIDVNMTSLRIDF